MNLFEYQTAAAVTAQPEAYSLDYLVPMIVGEIGELFGQKAKSRWHGWTADKLQLELVSEYGDVAWGTAILLSTRDVHHLEFERETIFNKGRTRWGNPRDPWQVLLQRSQYLHQWYSEEETHSYLKGEAQSLWLDLQRNCVAITGVAFEHVLATNLKKLADRAARGVLQGSGDHR